MKKIQPIKNFDDFITERHNPRKNSIIETAMTRIREKYGSVKNPETFLSKVKNDGGVESLKDFIVEIIGDENISDITMDYDDILRGLICSCLVQIQMQKTVKEENK